MLYLYTKHKQNNKPNGKKRQRIDARYSSASHGQD